LLLVGLLVLPELPELLVPVLLVPVLQVPVLPQVLLQALPELPALLSREPEFLPSLHNPKKPILQKQQVMLLLD
jgi:hypothetical protein